MPAPRIPALLDQKQDIAFTFAAPAAAADMVVSAFSVSEHLFGLTDIRVTLLSAAPDIDLHALLDSPATLTVHHKYAGLRHFSGVVAQVERGVKGVHHTAYALTLLPALHRLDHGSDCRIFQTKSVPDIIKILLKEHAVTDVQWDLQASHLEREYCVQYRETHLAFLQRIAAEEGIWHHFSHGPNGQHTLIFRDTPQTVPPLPGQPRLAYNGTPSGDVKGVFCHHFSMHERLRATSTTQRDYTFKNPPYSLEHRQDKAEDNGSTADYALYDYPGRYKADGAGKPFTKTRQNAVRVDATTGEGTTTAIALSPGYQATLTDHPDPACAIAWHLLAVSHSGTQPQALGAGAGVGTASYSCSFTAMPARLPYAPPIPPKPLVDGPQIAHVTGPAGEEIHTDPHGRVTVWFPWDRHGARDETSSCWIRVAQNWAGAGWGHIAIPRIGQEVIVDFLEGDPDQPIITGRTYHAANVTPYKLPLHKTRMVIRSDTHKGDGYNELSFEDEVGRENVFLHAQKDQTLHVLDNRAKRVENNQVESVGANKSIDIGGNHQEKIGGSMNLSVGGGTGGALMGTLGAILAVGGADMAKGSAPTGNGAIGAFAGAIAAVGAGSESASLPANATFTAAGAHITEAGTQQQSAAAAIGSMLAAIMPMGGIVSTVIEKFKSTTVGLAVTEQIGLMKNTSVGHTMTTQVGDTKRTTVGTEYVVTVGKSQLIMKEDGSIRLLGDNLNITMTGPVQINGKTIDLN
jgi:type VI secretion system secreted protein VgrG